MNQSNVIPLFALHVAMNPSKFRLLAHTQTQENYNHEEDYATNPYWKFKGGSEYLVAELDLAQAQRGRAYLDNAVECARPYIEANGPMYKEWIIGWSLLAPGEMTEFERDQLEFEGRIDHHPISVAELQRRAHVEKDAPTIYFPCEVDGLPATFEQFRARQPKPKQQPAPAPDDVLSRTDVDVLMHNIKDTPLGLLVALLDEGKAAAA